MQFKVTRKLTGLIEIEMEVVFFIYVREDIPSKELKIHNTLEDIESIFIKINLIKTKWLFCGCYHPPSQSDQQLFENIGKTLIQNIMINLILLVTSMLKNQNHVYHNSYMNTMPKTMLRKTLVLKIH